MRIHIPAPRAVGLALIAVSFAVGAVESGLFLRADDAIPLWDKVIHAVCALGIVLVAAPKGARPRSAVAIALVAGSGWEVIQFAVDAFQGHSPQIYAIDTITDLAADAVGGVIALRSTAASVTRAPARAADRRPAERTT